MGHQYKVIDIVSYFPRHRRVDASFPGQPKMAVVRGQVAEKIEFKQSVKTYLYFLPFLFLIFADTYDHE